MENLIHLILLSGLVFIQSNSATLEENLALKGTATQSTTYFTRVAQKAIDGIKHGPGEALHCAIAGHQLNPWWRLDLLDSFTVYTVVITNREDCCPDQTNGAEIRIGDSLENNGNNNSICDVIFNPTVNSTVSYSCNGMMGRYVNVVMTGLQPYLSLCEVEVYVTDRRNKSFLRLKFLSSVDVAALSNKILNKLQSALSLHISDFKLSWTQLPYKEVQHQKNKGKYKVISKCLLFVHVLYFSIHRLI
nr:fucolectin-like [Misgurnus anguillicaudatus]